MNQTLQTKSKRNSSLKGAKVMLATLGATSILGFWTLFSQQATNSLAGDSQAANGSTADNAFLDSLPPVPTLAPALSNASLPASQSSSTAAATPAAGTLFMGGAKPGSQSRAVRVVTRTRSSK